MSSFGSVLKHGSNYFLASVATSALSFISIPVYTRLLSTEDYGIVSLFIGIVSLLASLMSFSSDRAVSRYFFDQKNEMDFKRFVGTSAILAIFFFIINSIILILYAEEFGQLFGLSKNLVYFIIPITLINIIGLTFEQIYGSMKRSKEIALSSVVKVFLGFSFSIAFIYFLKSDKFYGPILGQISAGICIVFFWIRYIRRYFKWSFDSTFIKYIFTYSVPLIPYALSGAIIEQLGKIIIGSSQSVSEAGFYNLALSVSSIVNIIIAVSHQAWNPYYFEYMASKNYSQLDKEFIKIFKITIIVAFGVASFGKEIGLLLAKKEFSGALYLVPIFTIGYIFSQFTWAYLRNFGYSKSTQFLTIVVLLSGICNVVLNIFLIKLFGELGAAVSFVLSYVIMAVLAWFFNAYFVKLHCTPFKQMLLPFSIVIPFYFSLYFAIDIQSIFAALFIKTLFFFLLALILFWNERKEIIIFSMNIINRK